MINDFELTTILDHCRRGKNFIRDAAIVSIWATGLQVTDLADIRREHIGVGELKSVLGVELKRGILRIQKSSKLAASKISTCCQLTYVNAGMRLGHCAKHAAGKG